MISRRNGHRIAVSMVLSWLVALPALAADVPCAVGTQVEGEMGTGAVAEIGTEPPHVGWVRITHSWSPKGEWYDWRIWDVHPSGTKDRCVAPGASAPQPAGEPASFGIPVRDDDDPPAQQPAPSTPRTASTQRCPAGRAVVDRQQRAGKVLGEASGMCVVRLADGATRSYLDWMLAAPGAADPGTGGGGLELGDYSCALGAAGTFPITIGNGSYRDRAGESGAYSYDAASGATTFSSGSLEGTYSRKLGPGKFGLSSAPTKQFYAVCNRQ